MKNKVRIAMIGCGQICSDHLGEIAHIPEASVVGVCDLQGLLAQDMAERFGVGGWHTDFKKMVEETRPDVVHITTPPATHFDIGSYLLDKKCSIYVEKPICLSKDDTVRLIEKAKANNLIVCPGFMQLEDVAASRFRKFRESGKLGDVVHIESYWGNSLADNYSKIFLRTKSHWIHDLPGKLFQNIISHCIYHIVPFMPGEIDEIKCFIQDRSKNSVLPDELRVVIRCGDVTAYVTFTSAVKPIKQFVRFYGSNAIVELDFANHIFVSYENTALPGPLGRVRNAVVPGMTSILQGVINAKNFLLGKDRYFLGMCELFKLFYKR